MSAVVSWLTSVSALESVSTRSGLLLESALTLAGRGAEEVPSCRLVDWPLSVAWTSMVSGLSRSDRGQEDGPFLGSSLRCWMSSLVALLTSERALEWVGMRSGSLLSGVWVASGGPGKEGVSFCSSVMEKSLAPSSLTAAAGCASGGTGQTVEGSAASSASVAAPAWGSGGQAAAGGVAFACASGAAGDEARALVAGAFSSDRRAAGSVEYGLWADTSGSITSSKCGSMPGKEMEGLTPSPDDWPGIMASSSLPERRRATPSSPKVGSLKSGFHRLPGEPCEAAGSVDASET
mmetsp:Transcript_55147/g.133039  ORF Transcript_55147/g.133039 Transcript_55147/m.133039 type:complete len:292 (-) Transcript_55147:179-1054(-)